MPAFRCLATLYALSACGDVSPAAPPPAPPPAPMEDARLAEDSGRETGTGSDSGAPDGTLLPDGGEEGLVPCSAQAFELAFDPVTRDRSVAASVTGRGFIFSWGDQREGRDRARAAELFDGSDEAMHRILTTHEGGARDVQVGVDLVIWVDDGDTGESQVIRGSRTEATDPRVQTLSAATGSHMSPRLVAMESGSLALWLQQEGELYTVQARTVDDETLGPVMTYPWSVPTASIAVARAEGRLYIAWAAEGDATIAVGDLEGDELLAPRTVSTGGDVAEHEVSIAFVEGYGIVTYGVRVEGVRPEVRSRLLDGDAAPVRPPQIVSNAPARGRAPTAIAYAGGYGVAYRALNAADGEHIELAFVHGSDGNVVARYVLGESHFDGEGMGVAIDAEGALGLGWADASAEGTRVHAARLQCQSAWLRCGVEP